MKKPLSFLLAAYGFLFSACGFSSDVLEKDVPIPGQAWQSGFKPRILFDLRDSDTSSLYNVFLVLRHNDAYNYNNIWIRGTILEPGDTVARSERYDLTLATNDKGWLGSGMDDIYEHRILIQPRTKFRKTGAYSFTIEQVMRQDPLKNVLNVGVRIEKITGN